MNWTEIFVRVLVMTIAAMIPVVVSGTMALFRKGREWLEARQGILDAEKKAAILDQIETATERAVECTMQTYVNDLKKAASDGKLTVAERKEAMAKTITAVKGILLKDGIDAYSETIRIFAEAAIDRLKK